ncbi:MAG TPA: aspartate kinase, partial [Prolixibacteraceae bacterium]|nr:aspartate kinase [Prolixibacteraceae bacterium]
MKVLKFGGTSVGSPENMRAVMRIITDGKKKTVVLSAMSGTTNSLVEIAGQLYNNNQKAALDLVDQLEKKYEKVVDELLTTAELKQKGQAVIEEVFTLLRSFDPQSFTEKEEKVIVAQGELISTQLFTLLMKENGFKTELLPALDFMRIDAEKAADLPLTRKKIAAVMGAVPPADYYITQGFICRNADGEIDNLQRGGSDYSASLIGAALDSEEIQIWTDVDGMLTCDP